MSAASARKQRGRFVPVLVIGPEGSDDERLSARLDGVFSGDSIARTVTRDLPSTLGRSSKFGSVLCRPEKDSHGVATLAGLIEEIRSLDPAIPIAVMVDGMTASEVAACSRLDVQLLLSAEDLDDEDIVARLRAWADRRRGRFDGELFAGHAGAPKIIGHSPAMREVAAWVERVAPSQATVLILGESGTGKELIARAIHALSKRRKRPFIAINCAAIPETLLENELFGHEKGSYTGANQTAIGKVEAADTGTLFLDEIGDMPLPLQSKILRLLQDRTYDRIGSTKTRKADVRIVAATNRGLKEEVAAGRFREDLYYRLSVVPIILPALREKPEDIEPLAHSVLEKLAKTLQRPGLRLSHEALEAMKAYRWPGNVREFENEIERAAVLIDSDEIALSDLKLSSRVDDPDLAALRRLAPIEGPLGETLDQVVARAQELRIRHALEECAGDVDRAADLLSIPAEELRSRIPDDGREG